MNKKLLLSIIVVLFILGIVIGGSLDSKGKENESETVSEETHTGPFYVESTGNVFIIIAKFLDKIVYFAVVFCFDLIAKLFRLIFGI